MPWQLHSPVWCKFYDLDSDSYTAKVDGFISRVLPGGRAIYIDRQGREQETDAECWQTKEEAEAEIAKRPSPSIPTISERVAKE